jgi:exosortase D (VPLPA-CTERM-specific)
MQSSEQQLQHASNPWFFFGLFFVAAIVAGLIFYAGLDLMVVAWEADEYNHGYMIPLVALFLVWQKINQLPAAMSEGAWWGFLFVVVGLLLWVLGEVSSIYTIIQYGWLITFAGLVFALVGNSGMKLLWPALVYLFFMIPLPSFLYNNLSSQLQQISSVLGVAVIRLFDISVYLEGNVIDLGAMQLQVAEACNGLRYLFPLMSFGFLIAYLYRGPLWHKVIIFLSTIPITVLMNSIRIGLIGVSVEYWGIEMAQGVLHDFEGWVVFMACLAVLFVEMSVLNALSKSRIPVLDQLDLDTPSVTVKWSDFKFSWQKQRPLLISTVVLLLCIPLTQLVQERTEEPPLRKAFNNFPLLHNNWIGSEQGVEKEILDALQLTDYLSANFFHKDSAANVNVWIAYYASQRKGASIHSPRSCLPGGGWVIESLEEFDVDGIAHPSGSTLKVNRAVIKKDGYTQVVYYWFDGRNRNITNEYAAKWYIFEDAMTINRTDGALVRVIAMVDDPSKVDKADQGLKEFLKDFYPLLPAYIP